MNIITMSEITLHLYGGSQSTHLLSWGPLCTWHLWKNVLFRTKNVSIGLVLSVYRVPKGRPTKITVWHDGKPPVKLSNNYILLTLPDDAVGANLKTYKSQKKQYSGSHHSYVLSVFWLEFYFCHTGLPVGSLSLWIMKWFSSTTDITYYYMTNSASEKYS